MAPIAMSNARLESVNRGAHVSHVEDEGTGAPVILLPSSGMSGRQWRKLQERLVRDGFRTIAVDPLGTGRSSPWPDGEPLHLADDVDVVSLLLERVGGRAHLVGHSFGGLIALRAAA